VQAWDCDRIITSGNRKSEVEYDHAGLIDTVMDAEPHTTSVRYGPRGQLLSVVQ
jgi:hypothetical protein